MSREEHNPDTMEHRIELERRGKEPGDVEELILDNTRATQIEGLTDEYTRLESLSLIAVGLTTLKGFPNLPQLKRLELSDNRIGGGLNVLQAACPKLANLNLSGNKIKDLEALEPLKSLDHLTNLDLYNNPLTMEEEDFRNKVFKMLPSLKYLDGVDANGDEEDDEDEEANGFEEEEEDEEDGEGEGEGEDEDEALEGIKQTAGEEVRHGVVCTHIVHLGDQQYLI